MHKSPDEWTKVKAASVTAGSVAQATNVLQMALDDIAQQTDRFEKQLDYGIQLARIIEAICHGRQLPCDAKDLHHYKMAAAFLSQATAVVNETA